MQTLKIHVSKTSMYSQYLYVYWKMAKKPMVLYNKFSINTVCIFPLIVLAFMTTNSIEHFARIVIVTPSVTLWNSLPQEKHSLTLLQ